jgi:dolichol-phosphate mannosyltransferase
MAETVIVIPTYNEKENIEGLVSEIFRRAPYVNIVIVDDNSPDGTGIISDKIAGGDKRVTVIHRESRKERSSDGFKKALEDRGVSYVMEMDADFTHDPAYIPDFLKEIKHSDIVIGSRFAKGGSDAGRKFSRRCLSRFVNYFIRAYLGLKIKDCTSGYRCFKRQVLDSIDLDSLISKGPAVIEEISYIAVSGGFIMKEIPVVLRERKKGASKLNFKKLYRVLKDILFFKSIYLPEAKKKKNKEAGRFGFSLALGLNIAGCVMFYRQRQHFIWFTGAGSLALISAIISPAFLVFPKKALDLVILIIGRLTNILSLMIVFYLIFTPAGILLRIFRKDPLNKRIDRSRGSYWIKIKNQVSCKESYGRMG